MALGPSAYCSLEDLIDENVLADGLEEDDPAAVRAEGLIRSASRQLDAHCRTWFWPREYSAEAPLEVGGRGGTSLHLSAPPVLVTTVRVVARDIGIATWSTLEAAAYVVETDPENPSIQRVDGYGWPKGPKSVRIVGTLGYLEPDAEDEPATPEAIRRACIRLVALEAGAIGSRHSAGDRLERAGRIKSKSTNGRSVTFADAGGAFYTGDQVVDGIISRYRRAFV